MWCTGVKKGPSLRKEWLRPSMLGVQAGTWKGRAKAEEPELSSSFRARKPGLRSRQGSSVSGVDMAQFLQVLSL